MKRYLLFTGDQYYPRGGMLDFRNSYDNLDDAIISGKLVVLDGFAWAHIYDLETETICWEGT